MRDTHGWNSFEVELNSIIKPPLAVKIQCYKHSGHSFNNIFEQKTSSQQEPVQQLVKTKELMVMYCPPAWSEVSHGVTTLSDESGGTLFIATTLIMAWRKPVCIWHYYKFSGKKSQPFAHIPCWLKKQNSVTIFKPSSVRNCFHFTALCSKRLLWHVALFFYWVKLLFGHSILLLWQIFPFILGKYLN